jgi:hypothetical protein
MPRNDDVACLMRDRAGEASSLVRLNHNQEDFASSGCEYRNGPVAVVTTVASFAKRAAGTPLTAVRTETPRLTSSPPHRGQSIILSIRPTTFDRDVLAPDIAGLIQAPNEFGG